MIHSGFGNRVVLVLQVFLSLFWGEEFKKELMCIPLSKFNSIYQ